MFKSKYTIIGILLLILFSITNIFSIVYIEFNSVSLYELREHRVECGKLFDVLNNRIDFSANQNLSMNRDLCRQKSLVTLVSSITSIMFLSIVLFLIYVYIKNRKNVEDLTDLILILKKKNKKNL